MTTDEPDVPPLSRALLDAYEVAPAPPDLAERVLATLDRERTPRRRRRIVWTTGTALAVATAAAALLFWARPRSRGGERVAAARESIALGDRAVAVAEPGARLGWTVGRDGATEVKQATGDVFYRVERGGAFVVRTPAGDVTVKGTCFRVEVTAMKSWKAGVVGAAAAATLLLSVYEGRVLLANEHGAREVGPGERAQARPGASPAAWGASATAAAGATTGFDQPPPEGVTVSDLLIRDRAQRDAVAQLRRRVAELEAAGGASTAATDRKRDREETFVDPPKEELLELAKKCRVNYDEPSSDRFGDSVEGEFGLTPEERAQLNRVSTDFNAHTMRELRALYAEATGDARGAEILSRYALQSEIVEKAASTEEKQQIFQRISQERAGLAPPPADPRGASVAERYFRFAMRVGDQFEREVAQVIGPDRAHDLRAKHNGWGNRHGSSYGCPAK